MQDVITFGRFFIKIEWLILAFSGILAYIVLGMRLKAVESRNKVMEDTILSSLMIAGLVWKLSLILFEPVKVVNNPLMLVYFSGGNRGLILGLALAFGYLIYSSGKQRVSAWIYADLMASGFLAGTMLYNLIYVFLPGQVMWFYGSKAVLAALLLWWQVKNFRSIGKPGNLNQLLLWFSLGEIFIFHIKPEGIYFSNLIWGFSPQQLLLYALAVFAVVVNLISGKKNTDI